MTMEGCRWVPVGKVIRPHGVQGGVKIHPYGETLAWNKRGNKLYVGSPHAGKHQQLTILALKSHGKCWICQFQELTDRDEAQKFVGEEVFVSEEFLPPTSEDEYYYYQLIGLTVVTREGEKLGSLREILETPAHDVYIVDGEDGREILIPAVDEIISQVDLQTGCVVVNLPEGLLDAL
jgi:16S rRNA processing protein RimM